jgi:polygalacturonase
VTAGPDTVARRQQAAARLSLMTRALVCLYSCLAVCAEASPPRSSGASHVFNICDLGGTPDDSTDDRDAIRAAVQAAQAAGGGTIYFSPGTYLTSYTEWKSRAV